MVAAAPALVFLDRLADADRRALLRLGTQTVFARGRHLIWEGTHHSHVVIVTCGWAKVSTVTTDGNEVLLGLRGPGDLVGEMAALEGEARGARSASVRALSSLHAVVVEAPVFEEFLRTTPAASLALIRELMGRLRETSVRAVRHGSLDVRRHLAEVLHGLSARLDSDGCDAAVIDLGLTQSDLAGLLSCSRDSIAKALADLRSRGLVTTSRRTITIPSRARLHEFGTSA